MRSSKCAARRGLEIACLALGVWAAPRLAAAQDAAPAPEPAPEHRVTVSTGMLPEALEGVRVGLAARARQRLEAAGVTVADAARERAGSGAVGSCARAAASAPTDASEIVIVDLRPALVGLDVALRVYRREGCELATAARARGQATQLGAALDTAVTRILPALGDASGALDSAPAMSIEQLADEGRALAALADAELARAWRELDGDESPVARALRQRIESRASSAEVSPAERLRLRIARGEEVSGELATKKLLTDAARALDATEGIDARLALAAGEIRLARGEADAARPYLEKAAALAPSNPDAQLAYGRTLALLGEESLAQRAFERAAELEPTSGRALEELAHLQSRDPGRAAALLVRAGESAARGFDVNTAASDFTRAAQLDPASAPAEYERLGRIHASLSDPEQARASWRQAIAADGANEARLLGVARASRALGDANDAEAALRQALEHNASTPGAARELGALYLESHRLDEARPLLLRAVALDASDSDAKLELARLHASAGENDAALELLHAVELARGTAPAQLALRAELLTAGGDSSGARAALARAVELDPVDPALRLALADRAEALGDTAAAGVERERAALLSEASPAELAQAAGPESSADFSGLDESLVKLALSFAAVPTEAGRVIFVGVREPRSAKDFALDFLRPKVPNLDKLERGLRRVFESQYALMGRGELNTALDNLATADAIDSLYRFESERSLDANAAVELNLALESDALFIARLERVPHASAGTAVTCPPEAPWRLELRQLAGRSALRAHILGNAACLSPITEEYLAWNPRAAAVYGALLTLLALVILRGWGSVNVVVELPPQTRALFSISVSRRQRKTAQTKSLKSRDRAKWGIEDGLRRLNRYERPLREGLPTIFRWIPARRRPYYVTVRGPLQHAQSGELIGDFLEEQLVRVQRGARVTVKFDMRPKEASVEIQVSGAPEGVSHTAVALRGNPRSLRYVSDAPVFLYVKPGRHVLLVGAGDRLFEHVIDVKSFDPVRVLFDVGRSTGAVFSGSAGAVSAYLEGDVSRAAAELERVGQTQAATKLRADLLKARGDVAGASRALETAGDLRGAAELRAATEDRAGAAALFEAAEEFDKAGDAYRAAGDFAAASRAYERAGELDDAIACCKEAEDPERLLSLYEKASSHFEAGELAGALKQTARAIHNFSQVDASDSNYTGACRRLIELHIERAQLPQALARLDALLEVTGESESALPLRAVKAELLGKLDRAEEALEVWESIEARAPKFRGAADRAAALREQLASKAEEARAAESPAATPPPTPAPAAESRYEIQEELGRGAMGVVYKARDKHLGRVVALKRLTENLRGHPTAVAFFEREARAAAALNHPNIVTVYDAGNEAGHYFITMEFLQGTTLDQILRARGAMAAPVAAAIGMQVCAGLQYAHAARIIHRDIKTANLFYTRERIVKIMDFGLAKMVEEVRKGATVIGGTPFYMAPEQAAGENVDHRADLYALGVTLFELLTKTVPFRRGDVTFHHRNTPAPDPRERVAEIPAAMAELVMKLMQKQPDARYQSAAEISAALQPIASQL